MGRRDSSWQLGWAETEKLPATHFSSYIRNIQILSSSFLKYSVHYCQAQLSNLMHRYIHYRAQSMEWMMAPWIKYLLDKHEDLSSDLQHSCACNSSTRCETAGSWGSMASQSSLNGELQVQWEILIQKSRWRTIEEHTSRGTCWLLVVSVHVRTHGCMHPYTYHLHTTHTYTYTPKTNEKGSCHS